MELKEFLIKELRNLTTREFSKSAGESQIHAEEALKLFESCISKEGDLEAELESFSAKLGKAGAQLSAGYKVIIDLLIKDYDRYFDKNDLIRIEQGLKNDPTNRIYPLLWVFCKKSLFDSDEYLDNEYAQFIDRIVEEYDYLVNLDDFFYSTGILLIKHIWERWESDIFLPVFEKASSRYPDKYEFRRILAYIHYRTKDYDEALSVLNSIITSVEEEAKAKKDYSIGSAEFPYFDYLDVVQLTGMIHYALGDPEKAMVNINYVLDNLPVIITKDGEEPEIMSFVDSFMIRMHHSIKTGNQEQFVKDYKTIKGVLFLHDWENEYPEVFNYIREKKLDL